MPSISLLSKTYTYTNGNPNDADEVELDMANAYANFSTVQTDYNQLVTGAYTIAGVKTFSSNPKMDGIDERTADAGLDIDDVILKDGAISGSGVNAQTGTSYTILTGDRRKLITFSNTSAVAVTLPQAGSTGFDNNYEVTLKNINDGTVTITPTTSTIDGSATKTLENGQSIKIYSDGTNYFSTYEPIQPLLTKLHTSTVSSAVASVDIDTAVDWTKYDYYIVELVEVAPTTDSTTLWLRLRDASSYVSSAGAYRDWTYWSASGEAFSDSTTACRLTGTFGVGNATDESTTARIKVYNINSASLKTKGSFWGYTHSSTNRPVITNAGFLRNTAEQNTGVQILFSSGNVASGSVHILGGNF